MSSHIEEALAAILTATYGEEVRQAIHDALEEALTVKNNSEVTTNKVTEIDSSSTDTQYASAKAIYDALQEKLSTAPEAVKTSNLDGESVTEAKLATDAVTNEKIKDYSIDEEKLTTSFNNTLYKVDVTTQNIVYKTNNPRTIYVRALVNDVESIVFTTNNNYYQIALRRDGSIYKRELTSPSSTTYHPWGCMFAGDVTSTNRNSATTAASVRAVVKYIDNLTEASITNENKSSTSLLPSVKAVVDYLTENYIGNGSGTVTENNLATALKNSLYHVDNTTETVAYSADNPRTIYTNARVYGNKPTLVFTLGDNSQLAMYNDGHLYCRTYANGAYGDWIDLKAMSITESNKTSGAYPTVKAVYNFVTAFVASAISGKADTADVNTKEDLSNKIPNRTAMDNLNSETQYPSIKTMVQYTDEKAFQVLGEVSDVKAYIGYTESDILGLQVDFVRSHFTRLAGAEGLDAGSDFDDFPMFGGRRRCCVANDGTINAYYGEQGYAEDGTNGQVMVYQPKFYYRMVPLKLEKQASGLGYHIRKANYYVTANPRPGFKLHPLFCDANGNEVDYVLLSAYEGSMYDVSESAYVNDSVDTTVSYGAGDLLCSVAGKKPISGKLDDVGSKVQFETMANNIGSGWHLNTIKAENANQLLMMIELGTLNTQNAIGRGVVDLPIGSSNASALTGSTASLGNATGMASSTIAESAGTETTNTTDGKLSVSYRGVENPWGNIWKHVNGINLWGNGTMGGGQVFICDNFNYNEEKHDGNYRSAGFSIANDNGYISAFGYGSEDYDWVLMPSEVAGNSSIPVGDYIWVLPNSTRPRIAMLGGRWGGNGATAGGFYWTCDHIPYDRGDSFGGRLLYIPTANV